jgi:SAM-dependent methyltransferase
MFPHFSTFEIVLMTLMVIPTVYSMITGAPFVPTEMRQVRRMLKAAELKKGQVVYDLGSGDGRLVHTAAREYGARGIGYEFSPFVWLWAKFLSLFWRSKAELRFGNFWKADLRNADVIVCYLLPHSMERMKKDLLPQLKPGTLIVSHAFHIHGVKPWKEIPRIREERLGPIWIYKTTGEIRSKKAVAARRKKAKR